MFMRLVLILLLSAGLTATAETNELKDNATVVGRILTEKAESIVVDLGFSVVTIPRTAILKISQETEIPKTDKPPLAPGTISKTGLFQVTAGGHPDKTVRELVGDLGEAVVQVRTPGGLGSGFILNEEGYLITNFHVIEGETQISIEVYHQKKGQLDRKLYKQVRIIAMNKFQDLALLRIDDADAPEFVSLPLGDSDALGVGERVFAIGSPLGLERTVTEGILSTKTRQFQGGLYLQTTAQINPGNMKLAFVEGIGFAIPVESVKYFLNHRDAYAYDNDNPSNAYRYLTPPSRLKASTEKPAKP
jgi:serine protease Do